jgi:hypothetical protein
MVTRVTKISVSTAYRASRVDTEIYFFISSSYYYVYEQD